MFRLLIVDDESLLVDSLYSCIRERFELEVYRAYSAYEAMRLMRKLRFELVLTDISMPGMSGLELLEQIKRFWPLCRVIILTGFRNFDYAYRALEYDGVRYLLKVEEDKVILDAIEQEIQVLERELRHEEMFSLLGERVARMRPLLQQATLSALVRRGSVPSASTLMELELSLFPDQPMLLVAGRIEMLEDTDEMGRERAVQAICYLMERAMLERGMSTAWCRIEDEPVWILQKARNGEDEADTDLVAYVSERIPAVQEQCRERGICTLTVAVARAFAPFAALPDTFAQLMAQLRRSTGLNAGALLIEEDGKAQKTRYPDIRELSRLQELLRRGRREELLDTLSNGLAFLEECARVPAETVTALALLFSEARDDYGEPEGEPFPTSWDNAFAVEWKHCALDYAARMFAQREQSKKGVVTWAVKQVKDYVEQHYMDELSLTVLADLVHFNPSYLSRLFKEKTGENLQTYINNVRIKQVRRLLADSSLRVGEIASRTGFISSKYMIHVFRRSMGISPGEYRRVLATESGQNNGTETSQNNS